MDELGVPADFPSRVIGVFGDDGRAWLEELSEIVEACIAKWGLALESPFRDLSVNFVAPATLGSGERVVLKVACPNPEFFSEIEALRRFQHGPAVRLIANDDALGAFLIERVDPGTSLAAMKDEVKSTEIAAIAMRDLPVDVESSHPFPTLERWALAFERLRARFGGGAGPIPERLVDKAERVFRELEDSTTERKLMHGDLHHDNLLLDGARRWVVIDPKGVVGDPAYEPARYQHNPVSRFLTLEDPISVVNLRLDILAEVTGHDRDRLLAWAYFDSVLSVCWSVEDEQEVEGGVRRAQILDAVFS